jgi:hypothetical protein
MFCAPELIFDDTECIGSRFHVSRSLSHFQRIGVRCVPFSCFTLSNSFWPVLCASGPVFMFCATRLVFGGTKDVGSRFNVLRPQTHFLWYRGRRVPFSCFALPDSYLAVPRALGPVFKFCAPGLIFDGIEGDESSFHFCSFGLVTGDTDDVGSNFLILRSRTRFGRYRGHRVPF